MDKIIIYRDFGSGGRGTFVYTIPSLDLAVGCYEGINLQGYSYDGRYNRPLNRFVSTLEGDKVEVDTTRPLHLDMSSLYWESRWKNIGLTGAEYGQEIYPRVLRAMLDNLGNLDINNYGYSLCGSFRGGWRICK